MERERCGKRDRWKYREREMTLVINSNLGQREGINYLWILEGSRHYSNYRGPILDQSEAPIDREGDI